MRTHRLLRPTSRLRIADVDAGRTLGEIPITRLACALSTRPDHRRVADTADGPPQFDAATHEEIDMIRRRQRAR